MYNQIKDLRKAIERNHGLATSFLVTADEKASQSPHAKSNAAFYKGRVSAFYEALGFIDAALDEYENGDQPTPAEIATSDLVDYKALMECCRP
jgi:hypothetical protein